VKTSDFIGLLAVDSAPIWRFGSIFRLAIVFGILIAASAFFLGIVVRPDISQAIQSPRFLFKFVATGTLAAGATGAVLSLARPGAAIRRWYWVLTTVPLLLAGAAVIELIVMPRDMWMRLLVGKNSLCCLTLIPLLAIGPLAGLLIVLRQGASENPGVAGGLAGMAASGIAATFYLPEKTRYGAPKQIASLLRSAIVAKAASPRNHAQWRFWPTGPGLPLLV
jgi:hypothetical protein